MVHCEDLWHFDTASGLWMHYGAASGAPAARAYHGAAYDDVEEAIWIHGGYDGSSLVANVQFHEPYGPIGFQQPLF